MLEIKPWLCFCSAKRHSFFILLILGIILYSLGTSTSFYLHVLYVVFGGLQSGSVCQDWPTATYSDTIPFVARSHLLLQF